MSPVSRVKGHHGLTGQTWQRLTLGDGGWWAQPSPAQARPTRLRGHTAASGRGPAWATPWHQLPASCSREYGHTLASHWSVATISGLWLAGDDLSRPPSLHHVCLASVACHLSVTHMSRTPEARCDVLWRPRHSPGSWRHTQQLPSQLLLLRMLIITNYHSVIISQRPSVQC